MKTTLELPDTLVREIEKKAVLEGRTFKNILIALLRAGIALEASQSPPRASPRRRPRAAVVKRRPAGAGWHELTPERVADILHAQDALWHAMTRR